MDFQTGIFRPRAAFAPLDRDHRREDRTPKFLLFGIGIGIAIGIEIVDFPPPSIFEPDGNTDTAPTDTDPDGNHPCRDNRIGKCLDNFEGGC